MRCCYEAGPCGFELQRALTAAGIPCEVIAPALIPRRPGIASRPIGEMPGQLAVLYRAGALTAIHMPTEQEEAARDLLRCREDIRAICCVPGIASRSFCCVTAVASRPRRAPGRRANEAWLRAQTWPLPALDQTHDAYLRAVDEAVARLQAVDEQLQALVTSSPCGPHPAAPLLPRDGRPHRADHCRRIGRPAPVPVGPRTDGLRRPDPFGAFQRHQEGARRHHQNRQCPSPPRPCRSRVALSPSSLRRSGLATAHVDAPGKARRMPGGATATLSAVSTARRSRQAQTTIVTAIARELTGFLWARLTQ